MSSSAVLAEPHPEERKFGEILVPTKTTPEDKEPAPDDFAALIKKAGEYLKVNPKAFDDSIRHTVVKHVLDSSKEFQPRVAPLDLAVQRRDNPEYVTWSSASTILDNRIPGSAGAPNFELHTEHRVTKIVGEKVGNDLSVKHVVVRDLNQPEFIKVKGQDGKEIEKVNDQRDLPIKAKVLYLSCDVIMRSRTD